MRKIIIFTLLVIVFGFSSNAMAFTASGTQEPPRISITIGGTKPYPGDLISSTPTIVITATSSNSVQSGTVTVDSTQSNLTFTLSNSNYYATHEVTTALSNGIHEITIVVTDNLNNIRTFEAYPLYVQSTQDVSIQGFPLNYPNPFDPGSQSTSIGYTLSKPANITLSIFDLAGNLIKKSSYSADQTGGKAGYNEVTWDGKADSRNYAGNGIYIYLIIADGKVIQNGKGKLTVFKQ
ncbi:MAG: FlgD immunoglobulin-like domain containing protein [Candidatus Margulisiibacteriota bacterium]